MGSEESVRLSEIRAHILTYCRSGGQFHLDEIKRLAAPQPSHEEPAEGKRLNVLATALRRICTAGSLVPGDPLDDAYRAAGGGYGGLQEMAKTALEMAGVGRAPVPVDLNTETYTREQWADDFRDWLGTDDEYGALGAIHESLKANPQLVPERDVPLRLLAALRAAVDRFAALATSQGVEGND